MKKFLVKGVNQACLADRLENARMWTHTDLRSLESKIFKVEETRLCDFFIDKRKLKDFIKEAKSIGFNFTSEMSYGDVATIIYLYDNKYPDDSSIIQLTACFLYPVDSFARGLQWYNFSDGNNIENTHSDKPENVNERRKISKNAMLNRNHVREFYVWMDEYVSVLEQMFPNEGFKKRYYDEIHMKSPFKKQIPMLMEFVNGMLRDTDLLYEKWDLLLKYMIEPFYKINKIKNH